MEGKKLVMNWISLLVSGRHCGPHNAKYFCSFGLKIFQYYLQKSKFVFFLTLLLENCIQLVLLVLGTSFSVALGIGACEP